MTVAEMSAELDTIYENINKNGAPGLDDYEKSVILTHAEELLVKNILQSDPSASTLPQLVITHEDLTGHTSTSYSWGTVFSFPTNVIKVLNELITEAPDVVYTVIPITNDEFNRRQVKPYKYPERRTAWRLPILDVTTPSVEVFHRPGITVASYKARYVRKPKPIIISDLQTLSPFALNVVQTYSVTTAGSGYSIGDILTLATGTVKPTFRVMTLTGSGVATVAMLTNGYGVTAGANATTSPDGGIGAQITVTVVNSSTIDGYTSPMECELDVSLHRDILKIAAGLAEQYYYDKYGTDGDK